MQNVQAPVATCKLECVSRTQPHLGGCTERHQTTPRSTGGALSSRGVGQGRRGGGACGAWIEPVGGGTCGAGSEVGPVDGACRGDL